MRVDRNDISLTWFAVDRKGNIAAFYNDSTAYVPEYVLEDSERNDRLFELIMALPDRPQQDLSGKVKHYAAFKEELNKGLFCYEAQESVKIPNDYTEFYDRVAVPDSPLNFDELPLEIRELLGIEGLMESGFGNRQGLYFRDIPDFADAPQIIVPEWDRISDEELSIVPGYIRDYVYDVTRYQDKTNVSICCTCKCHNFNVFRNTFTESEKEQKKEYDRRWKESVGKSDTIFATIFSEIGRDGKMHWYKRTLFGKKELDLPDMPAFMTVERDEAVCCDCGRKILLFDNRFIGADACEESETEKIRYSPQMKEVANHVWIRMTFVIDEEGSPEDFSLITISSVDRVKKKVKTISEYEM